ncbi:MAG: uroporphyrinogen-III C-methyltransferase [Pseudomonadota bacterium]
MSHTMHDFPPASVWLVGAGPGDPELLTRKAERLLRAAEVVYYDALVSADILALIPAHSERHSVGKRAGRHSVPQPMICDTIVKAALSGKRVVRLKGGDPSIFGRANEELDACRANGIPVQICAGVTTASAAAASLGTSLTTRGLARRLTFVTAHTAKGQAPALDWAALADPQATIAVYMGKAAAASVSSGLISAGLSPETPVALIENVSLPEERIFTTTLALLPVSAKAALGKGPALILIGAVTDAGLTEARVAVAAQENA